jgi:hypothetical protein
MSQDEPAVNAPVETQETTTTASATVETKTPEQDDPLLDVLQSDDDNPVIEKDTKEKPVDMDADPKGEDPKPPEDTQETDSNKDQPPEGEKPLSPKSENKFQRLVNENKELRAQVEELNNQVYRPQTEQELIDEGLSPEMAEVRALKQQMELRDFNSRVYETQNYLSSEAAEVIQSYSIFDPKPDAEGKPTNPDYQPQLAAQAAEALSRSLIRDPNTEQVDQNGNRIPGTGQIIGYNLSPLQIYKPIADAFEIAKAQGQIQGQKATDQMIGNTDAPSSAAPKEPKKDPLMDILKSDD